jgi:hypothetical protein
MLTDPSSPAGLVLAHGLGGRSDLPVDPGLAAAGAATAVAVSFLMVAAPRLRSGTDHRRDEPPPPAPLAQVPPSSVVVRLLRALVLLASIAVVILALTGPLRPRSNLAPYALYVVFWVGLVPASLLFGPIWRLLNPLRTVHAGLCRLFGVDPDEGLRDLPSGVGMWPAAGSLLVFVWLELVFSDRALPPVVGLFLLLYAVLTLSLAMLFGRRWFDAGDGFEVYSTLIGSMAPIGRRTGGGLVWRNPLRGLAAVRDAPGLAAVVVVLIGSTGFDGLTRTQFWITSVPPDSVPLGTVGLLAIIVSLGVVFVAAVHAGNRLADLQQADQPLRPGLFAHSLIPIAIGYAVAHYFSFLLFEGQVPLALISDPFDLGWDLFGTARREVDYLLVAPTTIAWVQIGAIVVGHILGVVAAHHRALALLEPRRAVRSQYPLAAAMIAVTASGVLLLVST